MGSFKPRMTNLLKGLVLGYIVTRIIPPPNARKMGNIMTMTPPLKASILDYIMIRMIPPLKVPVMWCIMARTIPCLMDLIMGYIMARISLYSL
jgi:hypothetical protein